MKFLKSPLVKTILICVAVVALWPGFIRPVVQKLPVVGGYV